MIFRPLPLFASISESAVLVCNRDGCLVAVVPYCRQFLYHQRAIGGIKGCFVIWREKVKVLMPSVSDWQRATHGNAQISVASLRNGLTYWWNFNSLRFDLSRVPL
jgi:hypothetical protein